MEKRREDAMYQITNVNHTCPYVQGQGPICPFKCTGVSKAVFVSIQSSGVRIRIWRPYPYL
eukprot:1819775-Prymnesium_polylepis.1